MISIIIPTLNEEEQLMQLLPYLKNCCIETVTEIIIVDGGSTDNTLNIANQYDLNVLHSNQKCRATQMNLGALEAQYDILYFIHADSRPPLTFPKDIHNAIQVGYEMGRYRTKFDKSNFLLKINAFFTRFDWFICYGGDQTLFICKSLFEKINGYNEKFLQMEEYDLVTRAKELASYRIIPKDAIVSSRKYNHNSWLRVQLANTRVLRLYKKGMPQEELAKLSNKSLS
ncbi:MAG: TIGR04283 family arsenosugar biosynthesis glycosyltransferase [Saprospiraceae bacterium]